MDNRPTAVKALPGYKLWIRFGDGVEGEADLSNLVGKGVFAVWNDAEEFEKVKLGPGSAITWSDEIELCGDALYLRITGKSPEEAFAGSKMEAVHA